jgi:hypothetical protein
MVMDDRSFLLMWFEVLSTRLRTEVMPMTASAHTQEQREGCRLAFRAGDEWGRRTDRLIGSRALTAAASKVDTA